MSPETLTKIQNSFARQSLMATFGASMSDLSDGTTTLKAPILPLALQQHGVAHAGLTFALADSAGGYAALTQMPPEAEVVTSEFKIHLLAPAKGDHLIAKGQVIKPGRRLFIVQSDVWAVTGTTRTHVATGTGTMIPV